MKNPIDENMSMLHKFIANQLKNPDNIIGSFILGPLWNKRNAVLNDAAFDNLNLKTNDNVLDIGFGGGYLIGKIIDVVTEGYIAGIDSSRTMVNNCIKKYGKIIKSGRLNIQLAKAESLPYKDRHFTKVTSVNSIFYWEKPERGIREIYRILDKNGFFILIYTCKKDLMKKGFTRHGINTYTEDEIRSMMSASGFSNITERQLSDRYRNFIITKGEKD